MEIDMTKCPVCLTNSKRHRVQNKLNYHINCPRCGRFEITMEASVPLQDDREYRDIYWKISYWIKNRQDFEKKVFIDNNLLVEFLKNKIKIPSHREKKDNLIRWIGNNIDNDCPEEQKNIQYLYLTSIIGTKNISGVKYVIDRLIEKKLITIGDQGEKLWIGLTFDGWYKYETLKSKGTYTRKAFMAMKYGEKTLEDLFNNYLKDAVLKTGYDLFKLEEVLTAGLIDNQMRVQIRNARFVIADLTHDNHGAYWEAGYGEGLGKPVIYLCEKSKFEKFKTHFDTSHHTTIVWDIEEIESAMNKLKATIRETLPLEAKMYDE